MPAFNFQKQFAPLVADGRKLCTIRRNPVEPGKPVYLFTGMRTKFCMLLNTGTVIHCVDIQLGRMQDGVPFCMMRGKKMKQTELVELAQQDGFSDANAMVDWFSAVYKQDARNKDGGLDIFSGYVITWDLNPS
jgi:hypothetical protein